MVATWMGDIPYKTAISSGKLTLVGPKALTRNISKWTTNSIFAGIPSAREISN